ncbi:MAG: helix-turn-helix transcriptional regulator [Cyanobacteriota bacterium]|nr:helix-turn-helix transcriptional regulator [Cyanobacteriota bacterium]
MGWILLNSFSKIGREIKKELLQFVLEITAIGELPQMLTKARMAAKLSQQELANLAGLTEEQIKRYEANDYEDATFVDFMFVINALDINIQQAEFLIPLDTLRRVPVTKEQLLDRPKKNRKTNFNA